MSGLTAREGVLLIACISLPLVIGFIGSFFTFENIPNWYATLEKPWFTPPNWVFGPAWTILYILMGTSLFLIIRDGFTDGKVIQAAGIYGAQLVVNLSWSLIFFGMQSPIGALVAILILVALIIATIRSFYPISKTAAYLLVPYICWTSFATLLNTMIVLLN